MADFDLFDIMVRVFNELTTYIDIDHKFMCELPESSLNSGEAVNVLIGITGDMEGNIIFGYAPQTAQAIAAKLVGAEEEENFKFDIYAKAALADFCSEFCKRVIYLAKKDYSMSQLTLNTDEQGKKDFDLLSSYPSYVAGDNMYAMIGKVPSKKIFFKIKGKKFNLAYSLC